MDRIAQAELFSLMTLPDKVLNSWDQIESEYKKRVDEQIHIDSEKTKQTLLRYKKLIEKTIMAVKIDSLAWEDAAIVAKRKNTQCNMTCVDFCFSESRFRYQNIKDTFQVCLVAQCNCTTGEVDYKIQETK